MTVKFSVLPYVEIAVVKLKGKRLALNATSHLSQLLQGKAVTDPQGRTITHLSGLFTGAIRLLSLGIKPAYVFDGQFLEIKKHDKFTKDLQEARTTLTLSREMVIEAKQLLAALGVAVVQAPAESDAQTAHMCEKGDIYAVASNQYDTLMYGGKRLLMWKTSNKMQLYELNDILAEFKMDHNQFVMACMLVGTDFNPQVENQKNAVRIVQKYKTFTRTFEKIKWQYGYLPKAVYEHIKTMPVTNKYQLRWGSVDKAEVKRILVQEHGMNEKRVWAALAKLK